MDPHKSIIFHKIIIVTRFPSLHNVGTSGMQLTLAAPTKATTNLGAMM